MFNRIGLFVGLKFYVFRTMGLLNIVILLLLKNILNKVTIKMCNFYLQIRLYYNTFAFYFKYFI
jgi:hypothetical protein